MRSPDNFTVMNELRPARERRAAWNLRLSTLTFECNHGRVTRAVHCMLLYIGIEPWSCVDENTSTRHNFVSVLYHLLSITVIQRELEIFRGD